MLTGRSLSVLRGACTTAMCQQRSFVFSLNRRKTIAGDRSQSPVNSTGRSQDRNFGAVVRLFLPEAALTYTKTPALGGFLSGGDSSSYHQSGEAKGEQGEGRPDEKPPKQAPVHPPG